MKVLKKDIVKKLKTPDKFSHKGQNGKLLIIGGSSLFHGASLWALKTASRIVDMVFYLSVPKNQVYADYINRELYDFINIKFKDLDSYIKEADAILIGPGMVRHYSPQAVRLRSLREYSGQAPQVAREKVKPEKKHELEDTKTIVKQLLVKYPNKKWILDAGALQMIDVNDLQKLSQVIITPHKKEFTGLFGKNKESVKKIGKIAKEYGCVIVLKGPTDIICDQHKWMFNKTGNQGMTKGGTGDVLAGLIAALSCKNDLFTAAAAGTYITGLAGDELKKKVDVFFNASDLCDQMPSTFSKLLKK